MSETKKVLEQIRDHLKKDPPELKQALRMIKDLLIHGGCAREMDAIRSVTIRLLDSLVRPALAGDQEKQATVGRLIRKIRNSRTLNLQDIADNLQEIKPWMESQAKKPPISQLPPPFPPTLLEEALVTLSGKPLDTTVGTTQSWPLMQTRLGALIHREKKVRTTWQRERHFLQTTLAELSKDLADGLQQVGSESKEAQLLSDSLADDQPISNIELVGERLLKHVHDFKKRSREVNQRLKESREAVHSFRKLLRQADQTLVDSRDEKLVDVFTGIANRFGLSARIEQAIHASEGFSLIVIYLDEYSEIIHDLGRDRTNRLITSLVRELHSHVDADTYFARIHDETFAILFPGYTLEESLTTCQRLRGVLDYTRFEINDARLRVRTGFGVVFYEPGMSEESLVGLATMAAKEALSEGKERIRIVKEQPKEDSEQTTMR